MTPSSPWRAYLPWLDLKTVKPSEIGTDAMAALSVAFLTVPQCVAYAVIAGLPPAMGLYAAAWVTMLGSMMRSSRHVITGPSNAVSLLVGGGLATLTGMDPIQGALTLALLVGVMQMLAGVLRLGSLVDYISNPVVLGYITGAGLLIGVGQLHNFNGTTRGQGHVLDKITHWIQGLGDTSMMAVAMAFGTAVVILGLRKIKKKIPAALIAVSLSVLLTRVFDLHSLGLKTLADIAPIEASLPPLTMPDLTLATRLIPLAIAVAVLSLVESSAVARAIASRTGQRVDSSVEFVGQGLANICAAFTGAYPVSGSLGRSAFNERAGAKSRLSGVIAGVIIIAVLLVLGPLVNDTPVAALAGLLMVVAVDLVNVPRIKTVMRSNWGDRLAFLATLAGTWSMPLDRAIYLGVVISLVLFLRRARMITVRELVLNDSGCLREIEPHEESDACKRFLRVRILHLEGSLFFGAKGELQSTLEEFIGHPSTEVLILRLRRTQGMDVTIAEVFAGCATRLAKQDRHLILAGVKPSTMGMLKRTGALATIGEDKVFASRDTWFASMRAALEEAHRRVNHPVPSDSSLLRLYLEGEDNPTSMHRRARPTGTDKTQLTK